MMSEFRTTVFDANFLMPETFHAWSLDKPAVDTKASSRPREKNLCYLGYDPISVGYNFF